MVVNVVECFTGAQRAKGTAVLVDVFQAYTVACYALNKGARVLAVDTVERAAAMCNDTDMVLIGEQAGVMPDTATFANSPSALQDGELAGKTVVLATDAGTPALFQCSQVDEMLVCGFVNARAVTEYVLERQPEMVTMVAVGTDGDIRAQEDMMCAMYVKNEIEDYPNSFDTLKTFLATVDSSEKFFDAGRTDAPEEDYALCMALDRFDFAVRATPHADGVMALEKISGA